MHYVKDLPFRKKIRMYLAEKNLFIIIVHLQCLKQKKQKCIFPSRTFHQSYSKGYRLPQEVLTSPRSLGKFYLISEGSEQKTNNTTHTHAHRHIYSRLHTL